jgi:hypothetical protein
MRKRSFGRVLDGIVTVALASTVGAVGIGGCGGGTAAVATSAEGGAIDGGGGIDVTGFACAGPLPDVLSNLKPATPVDYVELRAQTVPNPDYHGPADDAADGDGGAAAGPPPVILKTLSTNGNACATATNKDACKTALAKASGKGWAPFADGGNAAPPPTIDVQFLVYTRGDEVGVVGTTAELATFLGPIDTLEEARLLLQSEGYVLACSGGGPPPGWKKNDDGSWEILVPGGACSGVIVRRFHIASNGTITLVEAVPNPEPIACGRRPEGLEGSASRGGFAIGLGEYFAEVAHLEAASVVAFRRLEVELRRFGAPESLVKRARRARADEIRHARETSALARRFGGDVPALEVAAATDRDLLAIAIENAAEGCVRETYGALVATFQARTAKDPEVRDVLSRIARDESRHAELSHDVAMWLDGQLDAASRAMVRAERTRALAELRAAIETAPAADVIANAGMPTVVEARELLDGLDREVLAA